MSGHSNFCIELFTNRSDCRFVLDLVIVVEPAVFNIQTIGPLTVSLLLPTHVIINTRYIIGLAIFEAITEIGFNFLTKLVDSPSID